MRVALASASSFLGAASFVAIVLILQKAQADYDHLYQTMSELALGAHGSWMLFAFVGLAAALAGLSSAMGERRVHRLLPSLVLAAAGCFLGAGFLPLGAHTQVHVSLIAVAYVGIGVVMYLLPRAAQAFANRPGRLLSYGALTIMSAGVAFGGSLLPLGLGQRVAAGALLLWICAVSWLLVWRRN